MNAITLLAMGPQPQQPGQQQPSSIPMLVTMGLLFVIFYMVLIRPQQKKAKQQSEMLKTLKSGDKVITNSGIIATIITVKEDSVSIRSADAKLEVTKGAIAEIRERSSSEASAS